MNHPRHALWCAAGILVAGCSSSTEDGPETDPLYDLPDDERPDSGAPYDDTDEPDAVAVLTSSTDQVDLGAHDPRCPADHTLTITNTGTREPLNLAAATTSGWRATLGEGTLEPGTSVELTVSWLGNPDASPTGVVEVTGFALDTPLVVPLSLTPTVPGGSLTTHLGDRTTADLLLAVDRSCNIDDMARIEPSWPTLRDALSDHGIDLRMASVVAADACILGETRIVDHTLDDDTMRQVLWDQQDWDGALDATTERLLEKAVWAFDAAAGGCNTGLHETNRPLHVLAFSDEPDQSPGVWSDYLPLLADHVDPGLPAVVHGIGDDADNTCPTASSYWGAIEAAEATGGAWLRWCDTDWNANMERLADTMALAHRRVDLATVSGFVPELQASDYTEVQVDGVTVDGWTVDPDLDALVLPEGTDLSGVVDVAFTLPAACGE